RGVEVPAVAQAEADTAGRRVLAVAHETHASGGGQRYQVVLIALQRVLEPGEFLGKKPRLLVYDEPAWRALHRLRVPLDDIVDQPGGLAGGQMRPFPVPLERVTPQHERVAVLGERLRDAGPHGRLLAVRPVERHAEVAGALRNSDRRPRET